MVALHSYRAPTRRRDGDGGGSLNGVFNVLENNEMRYLTAAHMRDLVWGLLDLKRAVAGGVTVRQSYLCPYYD